MRSIQLSEEESEWREESSRVSEKSVCCSLVKVSEESEDTIEDEGEALHLACAESDKSGEAVEEEMRKEGKTG